MGVQSELKTQDELLPPFAIINIRAISVTKAHIIRQIPKLPKCHEIH